MRRLIATAAVLITTLTLAGCGSDSKPGGSPSGGSQETKVITITVKGDSVTPNGDRVEVSTGQPIELKVTADAPGEIHVHSTPEQEFTYDVGDTTLELTIDAPGVVDVESHTLDKTIVQLEVS